MSDRLLLDLSDHLEWNLKARTTYQADETAPINLRMRNRQFLIEQSNVVMVGITCEGGRSWWKTGGWATQFIPVSPSSTSIFSPDVQTERKWIRLGFPTLCVFPKYLSAWVLDIGFPWWLPNATVEIWRYDGRDVDLNLRLDDIEQKVNLLLAEI